MAARTVKMCDMSKQIATEVFKMLNSGKVRTKESHSYWGMVIVTDVEPKDLIYPEGWYYAKGYFRNKHTSSTGRYDEVRMVNSKGESWENYATYCTMY